MTLPTPDALKKDLRTIGVKGFRTAMEEPLPALSMLPSVEHAAAVGRARRDAEIARLIRAALDRLEQRLAAAGAQYLLNRQEHQTRMERAAEAWRFAGSAKTFRRIRDTKLEPMLARALLNLAEGDQRGSGGTVEDPVTDLDDDPPHDELFAACAEGELFKDHELTAIAARKASVWWREPSSGWFGSYFASWYKDETVPCGSVKFVVDQGDYGARRFGRKPALDGPKDKLTIVSASWFNSDAEENEIYCGLTNYGFAFDWAKDHADELLKGRVSPSVFGAGDRVAYPGIAGVHTLMQTRDGYLLFGLRGLTTVTYHQLTWSASFEESVAPAATGEKGDETVLDTIVRGLREEWGIPASAVAASTTLAVGREFVRIDQARLDLSASILTAIRLGVDLATVWKYLDRRSKIIDIDEHCAWVAVRFASRADLLRLLSFARDRAHGQDLFHEFASIYPSAGEIVYYPGGPATGVEDRGLMPTSAARLYLGSRWLA